jgi:hypothetical protein
MGTFLSNIRQITHTKRLSSGSIRHPNFRFKEFCEVRDQACVSINTKSEIHASHPARLLLDLGDEYLVIEGYFSGDEFIEEGRQRRSKE